jgi:hypothetical protein
MTTIKTLAALALSLFAFACTDASLVCPSPVMPGEVFTSTEDMTHAEALAWCRAQGARAATIADVDGVFDPCDASGYEWCHLDFETPAWPYYVATVEGSIITIDSVTKAPAACVRPLAE